VRDTSYATELARSSITFPSGTEGRIERLQFKQGLDRGKQGIRFSWWKDGRLIPRPLDATEEELLDLLGKAAKAGVFSDQFLWNWLKALQGEIQAT
jgi:hypothetical protein